MKKFTFPLESVMKYRDYERDSAEVELGRALAVEAKIQGDIDALSVRDRESAHTAKGTRDFDTIQAANSFHALVQQKTKELLISLEEARKVSSEKREIVKAALQKSEALHRLYDRQVEEYKEVSNREEIEIQDDIATTRYNR